jgi:hypothetical protein
MKLFTALIDRIIAASGALLFAQMPMFIMQYNQQLAGRAAELRLQLDAIQRIAAESGKTLPEYISKFIASKDVDFSNQGHLINQMAERFKFLVHSEQNLSSASPLVKPFVFMQQLDWEVVNSTWQHFQFGIPFNFEGLSYGLLGLLVGCFLFLLCNKLFWLTVRAFQKLFLSIKTAI